MSKSPPTAKPAKALKPRRITAEDLWNVAVAAVRKDEGFADKSTWATSCRRSKVACKAMADHVNLLLGIRQARKGGRG